MPNCQLYGPISCPDNDPFCGNSVKEVGFTSANYLGWWECGPACLSQIRSLGVCSGGLKIFDRALIEKDKLTSRCLVSAFDPNAWDFGANATSSKTTTTTTVLPTRTAPYTRSSPAISATSSVGAMTSTVFASATAEAIVTPPPSSSTSTGAIVGAVLASVIAAAALAIALFVYIRSRKNKKDGDSGEDGQLLKRGPSRDMVELTDSGHMDLGPALGIGAAATASGLETGFPQPPPSIWDPNYVPAPATRKPAVTAAAPSGVVPVSGTQRAVVGPRQMPVNRSASVPTIVDEMISRPKPALGGYDARSTPSDTDSQSVASESPLIADRGSLYAASEAPSIGGMNAYRGIAHSKPDMESILADLDGIEIAPPQAAHMEEVPEVGYLDRGMSKYSSLGEASLAELHRYMIEESADRAVNLKPASLLDEPMGPKLALPSLKSVRTSLHSFDVLGTGPAEPPAAAFAPVSASNSMGSFTSPMARMGIPPSANPSMILPSFPSVRQQTMIANQKTSPAYRPRSYYTDSGDDEM